MTFLQRLKEPQTMGFKILFCVLWGVFYCALAIVVQLISSRDQHLHFEATLGFFFGGAIFLGPMRLADQKRSREEAEMEKKRADKAEFKRTHTPCSHCGGTGHVPRPPENA